MIYSQSDATYMLEETRDKLKMTGERVSKRGSCNIEGVWSPRSRLSVRRCIEAASSLYAARDRSHIPKNETDEPWPHLQRIYQGTSTTARHRHWFTSRIGLHWCIRSHRWDTISQQWSVCTGNTARLEHHRWKNDWGLCPMLSHNDRS